MSFGRPPNFTTFQVTPPDRGSFPLDHEGECKSFMTEYLHCMRSNKNDNGKCRHLSKKYLECRMERGLMEKDDMKNLGFQQAPASQPSDSPPTGGSTAFAGPDLAKAPPSSIKASERQV